MRRDDFDFASVRSRSGREYDIRQTALRACGDAHALQVILPATRSSDLLTNIAGE